MMRVILNTLILLSVIFLPATMAALVIVVCMFLTERFIESIFWAFILDRIYGGGMVFGHSFPYVYTICVGIIFFASFRLKKMLRLYPRV